MSSADSPRRSACCDRAPPGELDEPGLERLVRLPQLAVVDAVDRFPEARLARACRPVRAEMAVVDLPHLRREPGLHVHAVGDVADRDMVFAAAGEERRPHRARHLAVQRRHGVGPAAELERQHRHAEVLARDRWARRGPGPSGRRGSTPQRFAQRAEMLLDELATRTGRGRRAPACAW